MEDWTKNDPRVKDLWRWFLVLVTVMGNFYGGWVTGSAAVAIGGPAAVIIFIVGLYGTVTLMELARYHILGMPPMVSTWGWKNDKNKWGEPIGIKGE